MKKSLLIIGILAVSILSSIPVVFASWNAPMWYETSSNDTGPCPTLRSACSRQKAMNASTQRILEHYGRYTDFGTPEVCTIYTDECTAKTSGSTQTISARGTAPMERHIIRVSTQVLRTHVKIIKSVTGATAKREPYQREFVRVATHRIATPHVPRLPPSAWVTARMAKRTISARMGRHTSVCGRSYYISSSLD